MLNFRICEFSSSPCYCFLASYHVVRKELSVISIFLNVWGLFCDLIHDLPWRMFWVCLKKNVYSIALGWNVLYVSVRSMWSIVQVQHFHIDFLSGRSIFKILCFIFIVKHTDLSIIASGLLKSPTIILLFYSSSSDLLVFV